MSKTSSLVAFMLGMAVGSAATWQIVKTRYERLAEEEIASIKEFYKSKHAAPAPQAENDPKKTAELAREKPSVTEYAKLLQRQGYTNYSNTQEPAAEAAQAAVPDTERELPYVISPDDFGDLSGYDKISLTYFTDGVLADENNEEIDDVEDIVGDALEHFGEYDDNAVYVRNDAKQCDYEILKDLRRFSDVLEDMD